MTKERATSRPVGRTSTVVAECLIPHFVFPPNKNAWKRLEVALNDLATPRAIRIAGSVWHDRDAFNVVVIRATGKDVKSLSDRTSRVALPLQFDHSILRLSAEIAFPGAERMPITHFPKPQVGPPHIRYFTEDQAWEHWTRTAPETLSPTVQTFLMSICIAYSGVVRAGAMRWVVNGIRTQDRHGSTNPIGEAVEYLCDNNLVLSTSPSLDEVHRWVCSKNGIFDGYADSPSSRALNIFTRLFRDEHAEDEMTNLVWALAGIEALLVEGGRSSSGQLREKLNGNGCQPMLIRLIATVLACCTAIAHCDLIFAATRKILIGELMRSTIANASR